MNGIQSSLYTVAIALCVFSAGILSGRKSRSGRPFTCFTGFLVIETLSLVFELLMIHPATPLKALWLGLRMGTSLLIAPCIWLAIRESVEGVRPRLTGLAPGHRVAVLAGFALLIPLMGSAHLGLNYARPPGPLSPLHFAIHETMLLCIGIFAVQVPYYLWQCRGLLLGQLQSTTPAAADRKVRSLGWMHLPLIVVFTTWLLGLLRTLQCISHAPQEFNLLFALTDVGVTVGAIFVIIRRTSAPELHETPVASEGPAALADSPIAVPEMKYAKSRLDAPLRERIKQKLETALTTEELYRDSLLNLRSLSQGIKENTHYVSQVINQDLGSSFYQLVNHHRIERAKQLLVESPHETVLEIALAVGFNSKSTFNTAFRQNTGTTPSEYRATVSGPK